jgi:hypothetical protein
MSVARTCPICFRRENKRYNFGSEHAAEKAFHKEKWCDCTYESAQEMMLDQDMGFEDPTWIPIAKEFLYEYHNSLNSGLITNKEEQVRFFLKLLKSCANSSRKSIELIPIKENEKWEYILDGKTERKLKCDIFTNDNPYI